MSVPFAGLTGSVTYNGTGLGNDTAIANIKSWNLTVDVGSLDTTAFGDTNTVSVQGLRNATAQISGDLSNDATMDLMLDQVSNGGTLAGFKLRLIAGTGAYWYAPDAQITNIQVGSEVAGVASFSASLQLSGGAKYPAS